MKFVDLTGPDLAYWAGTNFAFELENSDTLLKVHDEKIIWTYGISGSKKSNYNMFPSTYSYKPSNENKHA